MSKLQTYYEQAGQDFNYLMQGASQYGYDFIFDELVPKALVENKKIVWKTRLINGQDVGLLDYSLEQI